MSWRPTRREFLVAGGVAALGAAAACGNGGPSRPTSGTLTQVLAGRAQSLQLARAAGELLSAREERIPVGIVDPKVQQPVAGGTGQTWFAQGLNAEAIGPFPLREIGGAEGLTGRGLYVATATLPRDGIWMQLVELTPPGAAQPLVGLANSTVQLGKVTDAPQPGDAAPSVPTPTAGKPRGVDPICTRIPACSMHSVSLDDALRGDKPVVVTIGTPQFCQSRFCGPVVDLLAGVAAETPAVTFIHVELLRDDEAGTVQAYQGVRPKGYKGDARAPAAIAWNTTEEPITYYIDATGTIVERHNTAIDEVDIRAGVATITA